MSTAEPHESGDRIQIQELDLAVHIGVPDKERINPQRLTVSITLWPLVAFNQMGDRLAETVNYSAVARDVKEFVSDRRDKLIETLADAIASHLLERYTSKRVRVELRKFVLPDAQFVAAVCDRRR